MNNIKTKKKKVYADYASATPIEEGVLKETVWAMKNVFGNPSAIHKTGVLAKNILSESRKRVADILYAMPKEIVFTRGATESINLAILGVVSQYEMFNKNKIPHVVSSNIEHSAVLETLNNLEKEGRINVDYVPVDQNGILDPKVVKESLKEETILVCVMYANNEIGTIQPIRYIAKEIRHFRKNKKDLSNYPLFFSDASQTPNYLPLNVDVLGVDLLTLSSSKIYAPKGVGVLYIKRGTPITSFMKGGDQENSLVPGTENVPLIYGFSKALSLVQKNYEKEGARVLKLRDELMGKIKKDIKGVVINGDLVNRLPNNIHMTIPGISSELLVLYLDSYGISVSSKSACKSEDPEVSHVLSAINKDNKKEDLNFGSLRISLGRMTKKEDIAYIHKSLKSIIDLFLVNKK